MSSISTEIFSRFVGSSSATNILAGKPKDERDTAAAGSNPLVALLSSGREEDDDDHTYDASGRTSGVVRMSAASGAGIEGLDDGGWFGDENGNPLPVKLEVRIGDKVVARVYEGGGTVVANGFDPAGIKIGPLSEGIEATLTEDQLTDFRMSQVMKFFSGFGATFETFSSGHDKGAGSNSGGRLTDGVFYPAGTAERDDEEAETDDGAGDQVKRTIIPQGMTLSEVLALSNEDYIAALEREKRRVDEAERPATPQPKAGEALQILQETSSATGNLMVETAKDGNLSLGWLELRPSGATVFKFGHS